jgi:cell division protein FtsL
MMNKIKRLLKLVVKNITNPELIAGAVITVTVVAVTINTSAVIMQNYTLQRDVQVAEQKVAIAQAELDTQRLRNNYYKSDAFMDIAARKQLSKGAPGEKLIIVPKSVAMSYVPAQATQAASDQVSQAADKNTSNLHKWARFLSGHLDE